MWMCFIFINFVINPANYGMWKLTQQYFENYWFHVENELQFSDITSWAIRIPIFLPVLLHLIICQTEVIKIH